MYFNVVTIKTTGVVRLLLLCLMLLVGIGVSAQTEITSLGSISPTGNYKIVADIDASSFSTISSFSGTLEAAINPETHMPYRITNLSVPLFNILAGTVKNLVIESVDISGGANVGAIACTANSAARIYNVGILGGSVGGTGNVGGLVGFLDGTARVINCYSYADITSGTNVGGLVGYNNVATNKDNLKTMVFGCMFYGDITGGNNKAPVYNGKSIDNKDNKGISNFNYFRAEASYVQKNQINTYNCALMAETRFLQRFEFFRHLLNGHRELAAWWINGSVTDTALIMKWVMLPDSIGSDHPYPVLKQWGRYPSVVNYDAPTAATEPPTPRNQGGWLGNLSVTIEMGSGGAQFDKPEGATITTSSLSLPITDKDTAHFNFNYYKVQLPYYNDVGTKNYTGNRVVTGWKITSITGGTTGSFNPTVATASNESPNWNFADRNCTDKDLYSVSGRVFNQGDYWDVPEGVTAITIQPYWAKAAYVADDYRNVTYNGAMGTKYNVALGGTGGSQWFTNDTDVTFTFKGDPLILRVYNAISSAVTALSINNSHTVYDYAVVLVGNHHYVNTTNNAAIGGSKVPYCVMSIDLDCDNEPDYALIMRFNGRAVIHPVKYDFINLIGLGMAKKSTGSTGSYNFGIPKPDGWFEVTNTALFRVTQMEYCPTSRAKKPIILHGGVIEQWVSTQGAANASGDAGDRVQYYHVGDNVWFKEFHIGVHQDYQNPTPHPPISVTGGDYNEFYLTGAYRSDANHYDDNAECYINGGHFGVVAGAGREGIGHASNHTNGNITWQINNADIDEFYGGGLNFAHVAQGNISTTISNSRVNLFCGGPKFGDMNDGRTVVTNATNCVFGTYFGAGYGGNSYNRYAPSNKSNITDDPDWNGWLATEYKRVYSSTYRGVSTQYDYQYLPMSGNASNVARIFVDFVSFSLATTHNVTSTLTGCTITGNFYGGGSLGKVEGPVTSTLDSCTVNGNVYGAGFSASIPLVEVDSIGFRVTPSYYKALGTYRTGVKGQTTTYNWEHGNTNSVDNTNHILYTTEDLDALGTVEGNATLTITGNSRIGTVENDAATGHVFGGGEESRVDGNTDVIISGSTEIFGDVYGGGNEGDVAGNSKVTLE